MNPFAQITQGLADLKLAFGDNKKISADLDVARNQAVELAATNEVLAAENADLKAKLATAEGAAVSLKADAEAKTKRVEELEATEKSAGTRAAAIVAAEMGTSPVALTPTEGEQASEGDLLARYAAITDPTARAEFYETKVAKTFRPRR